jgi:hypothetical protein
MSAIELKLRPFVVPNFAIAEIPAGKRQDGFKEAPSFPLHSLTPETLASMCDEFRVAVFAKAMKHDPAKAPDSRTGEGHE